MNKEKFHIPIPDGDTIQSEIRTIVSYIQAMYRQVGLKNLLLDGAGYVYLLLMISALLGFVVGLLIF